MFHVTETTQTAMFSADEERRYRALCLAVQSGPTSYATEIEKARQFEDYLRGPEEEEEPTE